MESSGNVFELESELGSAGADDAAALVELIDARMGRLRREIDRLSGLRQRVVQTYGSMDSKSVATA